eukprot:TRINITY_DN8685_c0_g1_i1.p1 TRINITY_DN8685_c0_g1~~TRINITY_DN8685_c0_g1_i1.p1  ORF type:complete len:371 (+),score=69.41 TRINITY_DN8685_c0_g1_i1:206-1318(+)
MAFLEHFQSLAIAILCIGVYYQISISDEIPAKRVVVLGASGFQGQAFVEAFLEQQRTTPVILRVVSRNISKLSRFTWHNHSKVELFEGDVFQDDEALRQAFHAQQGLFLVTFSDFVGETERQQGRRIIKAAVDADIRHVAFSGGARTGQQTLDAKADIEDVLRQEPSWLSLSVWHSGFFYENLIMKGGQPRLICKQDHDGGYNVTLFAPYPSDFPVVMHAASDVGRGAVRHLRNVLKVTQRGDFSIRSSPVWTATAPSMRLLGDRITPVQYAEAVQAVAKEKRVAMNVRYETMPLDSLQARIGGKEGKVIRDMFAWVLGGGMSDYDQPENIQAARERYPFAMDLKTWLRASGFKLVLSICSARSSEPTAN